MKSTVEFKKIKEPDAETLRLIRAAKMASEEAVQRALAAGLVVTVVEDGKLVKFNKEGVVSATPVSYATSRKLTQADIDRLEKKLKGRLSFFPPGM